MDKEEMKSRMDFNNIEERTQIISKVEFKRDYLVDNQGEILFPLTSLEVKLIEKLKELDERIKVLEAVGVKEGR